MHSKHLWHKKCALLRILPAAAAAAVAFVLAAAAAATAAAALAHMVINKAIRVNTSRMPTGSRAHKPFTSLNGLRAAGVQEGPPPP